MSEILIKKSFRGNVEDCSTQNILFNMDTSALLDHLPEKPLFDLVVTSPPYNIGKEYEHQMPLQEYVEWQKTIIEKCCMRLKDTGSICWQIGNYVENGSIIPLDIEIAPVFKKLGLKMRNRIIWHFGHGLHSRTRFSGRYEVVLWYTKSDNYTFNLDAVRIPSKYPGKKSYKGDNKGNYSGNPLGKNPEDVWDIPNVKGNHIEKTAHPCQFPVGLISYSVIGKIIHRKYLLKIFDIIDWFSRKTIHGRSTVKHELELISSVYYSSKLF